MRNFETSIIQCHVRRSVFFFFFNFVILGQPGGQERVYTAMEQKGALSFLAFLTVCGEQVGICREASLRLFPLLLLTNDNKIRSRLQDKNFPKYLALSMLNKTALFRCIHIILFTGKITV